MMAVAPAASIAILWVAGAQRLAAFVARTWTCRAIYMVLLIAPSAAVGSWLAGGALRRHRRGAHGGGGRRFF